VDKTLTFGLGIVEHCWMDSLYEMLNTITEMNTKRVKPRTI